MPEQTLRVHDSLADALAEVNGRVPEGLRPYVCRTSSGDQFVISNSPGQAAMTVCERSGI